MISMTRYAEIQWMKSQRFLILCYIFKFSEIWSVCIKKTKPKTQQNSKTSNLKWSDPVWKSHSLNKHFVLDSWSNAAFLSPSGELSFSKDFNGIGSCHSRRVCDQSRALDQSHKDLLKYISPILLTCKAKYGLKQGTKFKTDVKIFNTHQCQNLNGSKLA